jgi:hypothetical protein
VRDAAIEAELETAGRPETLEEARHNVAMRVARIIGGFALIVVGIIALPLPIPGWLIILVGLELLPYVWAERTIRRIRRHAPGVPEEGRIPARTWAVMGLLVVGMSTAGILFGADVRDWVTGLGDPGRALG